MTVRSIKDILSLERTEVGVSIPDKERALYYLSELVSRDIPDATPAAVLEGFLAREALGSTGIGDGIAIPHCRLLQCKGTLGTLIRLQEPIDFDAVDRQPVDLLFALLVPEQDPEQHLQALGMLAHRLNQPVFRQALRDAADTSTLYSAAISYEPE